MIFIGIYTGFRPSEVAALRVENVFLDENKLIGGMKTEAGTDRKVPIHPCIKPLIEKRYYQATEIFQSKWLFNDHRGQQGTAMTYDKFRRRFEGVLRDLGMCHTVVDFRYFPHGLETHEVETYHVSSNIEKIHLYNMGTADLLFNKIILCRVQKIVTVK